MVTVIGNSPERVEIDDLGEIIYYRQIKDFTDEEYKKSRDLKKAINKGSLSKIAEKKSPRGSLEVPGHGKEQDSPISLKDLKAAIREILPKSNGSSDIAQAVREIGPLIADMVRQEMSKISVVGTAQSTSSVMKSAFKGPEYIPDVNIDGMVSNVEADERTTSADEVNENLAALRQLQNKSKSK